MTDRNKSEDAPKAEQPSGAPRCISRRGFLGLAAAGGYALVAGNASAQNMNFGGWPESYGMLTDFTACVGCRSCEKACNEVNNMPKPETSFDDPSVFNQDRWPTAKALTVVNKYEKTDNGPVYRKIQCNHCLEPACASACPIHAYTKTPEGAVIYDKDLCFGCRYCVIACPFNIPAYDYESALEPKIVKCILCYDRIKEGKLPGCADACPAGAITFGKRDKLLALARKRLADNPGKYVLHIYGEKEVGGTSWLYISGVPFEQLGFPTNLPQRPLIELTRGYLSSIPVIFTVWPAFFGLVYTAMKSRDSEDKSHSKEEHHE